MVEIEDTSQPPGLDGFLIQNDSNKPAVVNNGANNGAWFKILADQQLQVVNDITSLQNVAIEKSEGDVLITWKPNSGSNVLLIYQFSSERNSTYFQGLPLEDDGLQNTARVGDGHNSGVMLLKSPASTAGLSLRNTILPAFGISLGDHSVLSRLLAVIDSTNTLTAKLKTPPDWLLTSEGKPDIPLHLPTGSNVYARAPTNALWCTTQSSFYTVALSVTYILTLKISEISKWLSDCFGGLAASEWASGMPDATLQAEFTLTRSTLYNSQTLARETAPYGLSSTVISLAIHIVNFDIHMEFFQDQKRILLVPTGSGSIFSMITGAFQGTTGDSDMLPRGDGTTDSSFFRFMFNHVYLWNVGLTVAEQASTPPGAEAITWNFGLLAELFLEQDTSGGSDKVVIALSYDSSTKTFLGRTLFKTELMKMSRTRAIDWDPRVDPSVILRKNNVYENMVDNIDILKLVGVDVSESPIHPILTEAQISFTKGDVGNSSIFTLYSSFSMGKLPDENAPVPFEWNTAAIDVVISKGATTSYTIDLTDVFTMTGRLSEEEARANVTPPSAVFAILLHFEKTDAGRIWSLRASARNLSVRLIRSFFDTDVQDGALAVMDRINLASIDIAYVFQGKNAASFLMTGVLQLGELELDLRYDYSKGTNTISSWNFEALLRTGSPSSTIASIAESIVPGSSEKLPEFVGSIPVAPNASQAGSPVCLLKFGSDDDTENGRSSLLSVWLSIAGFSLTFVQYQTRAKLNEKSVVKRVLRISVDQIPMMNKIPIIGEMPQPFDHLAYLWVEDDSSKLTGLEAVDSTRLGISRAELEDIKSLYPPEIPPFQVRESASAKKDQAETSNDDSKSPVQSKGSQPVDIALAHGHHFVVVVGGTVVLDHVFNTNRKDSQDTPADTPSDQGNTGNDSHHNNNTNAAKTPEAQPTKGTTKTSAGPLSINALTLQYKQGHLIVSVDATLKLGPLTFSVIGFALDINLKGVKLHHLADIVAKGLIEASLHGMEVGLSQGPLTLKGVFVHDKSAVGESYRGGIAVGFKAWQVLAVGEYFIHLDANGKEDYKAVFVYGKLDGPLVELEFATISGVRVGFGYNYAIRIPDLQELSSFPLISDGGTSESGNDPGAILEAIRGGPRPFVYTKKGSGWFAAGMTITAFDVLTLTAVLVLDIDSGEQNPNEKGVIIAMFADGVFQMEPLVPPEFSLFYIELVVKVELNFVHGYIAADAALAPASHIYVPMAHLTGQASFYTWFGNNPHAGDWVVSIGGYSRTYKPFDWYPKPARVDLNFTVGDNIQMIGQAYCAVTPKCAMAGGSLHLSLSVGPVSAYADLVFDAFINFEPFHFRAQISLSVGVECDIDILFVHIHVSIHLGADLVVWGPRSFGGRAHVNFWFFGFDISFGANENEDAKNPIALIRFIEMVIKPGPNNAAPPQDTIGSTGNVGTNHKYSVEDGLAPQVVPPPDGTKFPSTGATSEWHVLAGTLRIRVDSAFALSKAYMELPPPPPSEGSTTQPAAQNTEREILLPDGKFAPDVYSWPMHCKPEQKLTSILRIAVRQDSNNEIQEGFKAELVLKTASKALWSIWDPELDPLHASETPDHLTDAKDGTVDLVQAVRILPPDPERARSKIIDMDATAAMKFTIPFSPPLPPKETQPSDFEPSYFEAYDTSGTKIDGVKRWRDFQDMWVPPSPEPPSSTSTTTPTPAPATTSALTSPAVAELRTEATKLVANILEWDIRPPEQMIKNNPPPPPKAPVASAAASSSGGTTTTTTSMSAPSLVPLIAIPNAPRTDKNGRTDWELNSSSPEMMVRLLDIYYQALPLVC